MRISQLEKKKRRCMDYSSMPNRCVNKVEAQIARVRKVAKLAKFRTKALESKRVSLNLYLDELQEARPSSPIAKVVTYGLVGLGALKAAGHVIKRSDCKQYKYSPYLHKRCMKNLDEAEGWHGLPKGWKHSSLKKFSKSLTGKEATKKGFFDKCVKRMKGKIDNPEAFCAATKDEAAGSTFWRGKGKSPQQAGKDVKRIRNVRQEAIEALRENEFLQQLNTDNRTQAQEWQGPNIPYGDDSNRPNLIRKCTMMESATEKINCLRKLRDQTAMNPFYQYRIDRYIDEITDTYEPTSKPGTIPGNEFKTSGVGEDTKVETVTEGRLQKAAVGATIAGATIFGAAQIAVVRKCRRRHPDDKVKFRRCFRRGGEPG